MLTLFFGLLTVALVLLSALLILLVLVQLPKKDAGTGIAFGGATADALFGAGSGNVLTKITTYATIAFIGVIITLSYVHDHLNSGADVSAFAKKVQQQQQSAMTPAPATQPVAHPAAAPTNSIQLLSAPGTTAPAAPATKN
jgi:preprotein translocase subunit SecG